MKIIVPLILLFLSTSLWADEDYIAQNSSRFKNAFFEANKLEPLHNWMLPFLTSNREDISTIAVISTFGSYRSSHIKGHKHTGIDIVPKARNGDHIWVYPIGKGIVCSIHLGTPHITVVVKHETIKGEVIYSSYKHLYAPLVQLGTAVDTETILGRLYTPIEGRQLGGDYHHLHLEIRKQFDDFGVASWATMTRDDLNKRFFDPWVFLKEYL